MNGMKWNGRKFMKKATAITVTAALAVSFCAGCGGKSSDSKQGGEDGDKITITNVSYDPTRELYQEYNQVFADHYKEETGKEIEIVPSHGGSGAQARSVIEGNDADVVTLALAHDITSIENAGMIESGWIDEFEGNSSPYKSTIVLLVRKGNEKNIKDWDDLAKDGVDVIAPDPKSSGAADWGVLAMWNYAKEQFDGDEEQMKDFVGKIYGNVLVMDSGARGATTTFVENKQGDVLVAWENEALLTLAEYPDDYEMVTPSISILAEPSVAIVDENADKNGTQEVAKEYLSYLYSDEAQRIIGENYYRPSNEKILKEFEDTFDLSVNLCTIDDFGGWDQAYEDFFADDAIFDQIYSN